MRPCPRLNSPLVIALALFGLALGIYLSEIPPSITWKNSASDSGDLATAVKTLGVAHPPGYPAYILTGKLFTFLPFGDIAHRLSIMSAVLGAAAGALTFLVALRLVSMLASARGLREVAPTELAPTDSPAPTAWLVRYVPAALAGLSLAFAPVFWGQAVVPEVYALNAFFGAAIFYLLLSWLQDVRQRPGLVSVVKPVGAAFLLGLGMGGHFTLAPLVLPPAAAIIWRARRIARVPSGWMAAALVLGLGIYIYLPVAAAKNPPVNWGDPSRLSGFAWDISGKPYQSYVFGLPKSLWGDRLGDWAKLMVSQFQGLGVALALVGVWRLWRWDRLITGTVVFSFLGLASYATFYSTADSFVFLIPTLFIASLAIGAGAYYLLAEVAMPFLTRSKVQHAAVPLAAALALAVAALVPGTTFARNYADQDLSGDTAARDYAAQVFATVEPNAVVLADSDEALFSLWYQQFVVDGDRRVTVIARNLLQFEWYTESFRRRYPGLLPEGVDGGFESALRGFVQEQMGKRPVYVTFLDPVLRSSFILVPVGRVFRIEPVQSS